MSTYLFFFISRIASIITIKSHIENGITVIVVSIRKIIANMFANVSGITHLLNPYFMRHYAFCIKVNKNTSVLN